MSKPSAVEIARWAEDRARRQSPDAGISRQEQWQIVTASRRVGMTLELLAAEFGRSEVEVGRVLADWSDTTGAARHLLKARALELADRMMTDPDPGVALEILERLQVVETPQAAAGLVIQIGSCDSLTVDIGSVHEAPARGALPAADGSRDAV